MSMHITQLETQGYNSRTAKPGRTRSEAKLEVREGKPVNRIINVSTTDVEPKEARSHGKATTNLKSSEKSIKITKVSSGHGTSGRSEGTRRSFTKTEHVSSTVHFVGSPKPKRTSKENVRSILGHTSDAVLGIQKYVMADCDRNTLASCIPRIPKEGQDEQPLRKDPTTKQSFPPPSNPSRQGHKFAYLSSVSTTVQTVRTEPCHNIDVSSYKQPTSKQPQDGLRVKGQSGSKIQRNADVECYPNKTDRSHRHSKPKSREDNEKSDYHYLVVESQQTEGPNKLRVQTQGRLTENITTECSDTGMSHYDQKEQFSRQAHCSPLGGASNTTSTDSGSGDLSSSSDNDGCSSSVGHTRGHTNSPKRRKRVKRKGSAKSIGSSMYGDDNTTDGESATDTLTRVHDRRSRRKEDENNNSAARQNNNARAKNTASGTSITTVKGAQFRSSSLTSVSSVEGGRGRSATSSPLLTPRGTTLVKKIQIQSFSATCTEFNKENKENQARRRASVEEHIYDRTKEKTLIPGHSGSMNNSYGSLDRNASQSGPPASKGRPFALRNKPFQLRRSSSKESPYTSETESIGSPFTAKEETDTLSSTNIPQFTDKPNRSCSPVSSEPKEVSLSSSIPPTSPDFHIESQYSVSGIDENVFSSPFAQSSPTHSSDGSVLAVFETPVEKKSSPLIESTPVSVGEATQAIPIPGSSLPEDTSEWVQPSYPPLRTYPFDSDSYSGGSYGLRALSIVNEQEEMDGIHPTNTESFHDTYSKNTTNNNNNTRKNYRSSSQTERENNRNGRKKSSDLEEVSAVRRPSYIRAQQNVENFSLFHSFDDDVHSPPQETSLTDGLFPLQHPYDSNTNFEQDYDPKEVLKSFSGSDLSANDALASVQKGGDLITFDDEHCPIKGSLESSEEPVVKKRKKKIARPKIPTIFGNDKSTSLEKERFAVESDNDDDDDDSDQPMIRAREETMGQDSMDEKCMDTNSFSKDAKDEEFDMIEASKRNTLVAIDSDDGSTPKATHSPASEPEDSYLINQDKDLRTKQQEKHSPTTGTQFSPSLPLPQITTDLYDDSIRENSSHLPLKKVDTLYDLSEEEFQTMGLMYVEQEPLDTKSVESFDSQSDGMSPRQSQSNLDKYSLTTSGFSEIAEDFSDSCEISVQGADKILGVGKSNADGWRSHSDPSGRTNGAGAPLSETIAEAVELTSYRNSNSAPNLINEKLKKEAAYLSERIGSNQERSSLSRTRSSPSSFPKPLIPGNDQSQRKNLESKDDSQLKLSPDTIYEMDVGKPSLRVHSAPSTPTSPRKQLCSNAFSSEKAQMKLAKLAAMEPIYETPQTELIKPLPEPVKLEPKCGVSPGFEEPKRPPATGLQESKTQDKLQPKPKSKHDIKRHVLQNLLETEQSYVQNLQYLVTAYYKPLKKPENANIVDPAQADEMFYQISDILLCHEFFLEQLEARVDDWHDKQKIGDILVASFTKCFLMDAYSAFINHFLHARAAVRIATVSRPGFQRFIEQCSREHKEKLTLQDLMIMPVQRIPRYVLILKDMIKHTAQDHPDYGNLLLALGEIKTLADRMNKGEKEVNEAEIEADRLRDIEASIEGIAELVVPNRRFLRKDLAAEVRGSITKKDRCLFLFTDLLVCASVKRKPNALRRGSLSLFSGQSGSEFNKHKLLWKMPLEYIELVKSSPELQRRNSLEKQIEKLENDMSVLSQISSLTDSLNVGHQALDASIRELMNEVSRQIAEKQIPMHQSLNTRIELQTQTEDGLENFVFLFLDVEIKNTWEAYFENAKQKLAYAKDTFPPEFQYPIPITKTRSGMQFTCSSPSQVPHMLDRGNHCGSGDVWVCNSDGYVGQVCILSMGGQIQPIASLSVCSSRILCISPVPGTKLVGLDNAHPDDSKSDSRTISNNCDSSFKVSGQKLSPGYSSDDERNAQTIMAFDSSSDDEEGMNNDSFIGSKFGRNSPIYDGRLSPEGSSLGTIDGEMDSNHDESEIDESEDEENKAKASQRHSKRRDSARTTGSVTSAEDKLSLSDIVPYDTEEGSAVWLGTEDGSIFVYPTLDAHQKKNKMKIQHQASVQCILYVDNQVFVSLGNGDLCIYRRQPGSAWEVGAPITLQVGSSAPVSCMTAVHGRLWCGCQCNAVIYNTTTLKIETQFNCSLDKDRSVYRMVSSGMGVWLSLQSSAVIRLFHATRYECLADVDVAPPVHKMLAGSDAIIRQHKAACLRVTSLLTCKDLLWIGTSAGVVLTLPLPTITATTSSLRNSPSATASYHGHTGHVRFLTAVEVPKEGAPETTSDKEPTTPVSTQSSTSGPPLTPGGPAGSSIARNILIISGGDGYEDFKTSSTSESAGRDDSTNHLLIWRV